MSSIQVTENVHTRLFFKSGPFSSEDVARVDADMFRKENEDAFPFHTMKMTTEQMYSGVPSWFWLWTYEAEKSRVFKPRIEEVVEAAEEGEVPEVSIEGAGS
jgi:hypothetical protein